MGEPGIPPDSPIVLVNPHSPKELKKIMTQYRVVSEPYTGQPFVNAERHRRLRGDDTDRRLVTEVSAPDILVALNRAIEIGDHAGRSITSLGELLPAEALYFSDAELTAALRHDEDAEPSNDPEKLYPEEFEGRVLYDQASFEDIVESVVKVLRNTLLPGLSIKVIASDEGNQAAMLEVYDEATGVYHAKFGEMKTLIEDRSAIGWEGILSIAKAVISTAAPLV